MFKILKGKFDPALQTDNRPLTLNRVDLDFIIVISDRVKELASDLVGRLRGGTAN